MKKSILCAELEAGNIFLPVTKVQTLPVRATISYYSISNNQQGVKSTLPSQSHTNPSTSPSHLSRGDAACVSRDGLLWRTLPPASSSATQTWPPSPWPAPGCRHPPPPASTSLPTTLTASASRSILLPRAPPECGGCASAFLLPPPRATRDLPLEEGGGGTRSSVGGSARGTDAGAEEVDGPPSPAGVRSAAARPPWLRAEGRRCSHLRGFSFLIKNKPGAWIHNLPTSLRNN